MLNRVMAWVVVVLAMAGGVMGEVRVVEEAERLRQWEGYAAAKAEGAILYVSADGSGDFNCDGQKDQVQINAALQRAAGDARWRVVHLKGPGTYTIDDTIRIPGGVILQGDADAVLTLVPHSEAQWPPFKAMIECDGHGVRDIAIRGFEIRGNRASFSSDRYYYPIVLMNAYDAAVHDMYIHRASGDGIKFEHRGSVFVSTGPDPAEGRWVRLDAEELAAFNHLQEERGRRVNARFYNNRIETVGHDGIYLINVEDFEIFANHIYNCRTNSSIRASGCSDFAIYDNVLRNDPSRVFSGNAGVQVQMGRRPVDNVRIYGNRISRMGLGGIVVYGGGPFGAQRGIHIHDNIISDCAIAGIRIYGAHETMIEHNVLYANQGDGILHWFVYGPLPAGRRTGAPPEGERYTTIVRHNIIVDTVAGTGRTTSIGSRETPVSGYGLNNCVGRGEEASDGRFMPDDHRFVAEYNCIWNNETGPYYHVDSRTDIHADPRFVDAANGDFRLGPDSPARGAGEGGRDLGVRRER